MALAYSAYLAEIFRSGINAIPVGQIEAAASIGLNRWQTARLIILPQAFRIVIPPLGNELIAILKDTSLLSILSIRDITQRMREFQSASFLPFAPYNSAAILYILLSLEAYSLLIGSLMIFAALAAVMYFTRNIEWRRVGVVPAPAAKEETPA